MTTLEDKLLGEKQEYYCSSSEEDEGKDEQRSSDKESVVAGKSSEASTSRPQQRWDGVSKNTGPKGVLEDWYLYQKQEEQLRLIKERELISMVERASMTCLPENHVEVTEIPQRTSDDLESDDILKDFLKQRMESMKEAQSSRKQFGGVEEVKSGDEYLKLVDETDSTVTIILHIYESTISQCLKMNECLDSICKEYPHVRFCKMKGSVAGVSDLFKVKGVPALLVYRGGDLIGNFVRLKDEFGSEFYPGDVENYLIENGILDNGKH